MNAFDLAIAMAHNVTTELSAAAMQRQLTKDETLLHGQACRTLQQFFKMQEAVLEQLSNDHENRLYEDTNRRA